MIVFGDRTAELESLAFRQIAANPAFQSVYASLGGSLHHYRASLWEYGEFSAGAWCVIRRSAGLEILNQPVFTGVKVWAWTPGEQTGEKPAGGEGNALLVRVDPYLATSAHPCGMSFQAAEVQSLKDFRSDRLVEAFKSSPALLASVNTAAHQRIHLDPNARRTGQSPLAGMNQGVLFTDVAAFLVERRLPDFAEKNQMLAEIRDRFTRMPQVNPWRMADAVLELASQVCHLAGWSGQSAFASKHSLTPENSIPKFPLFPTENSADSATTLLVAQLCNAAGDILTKLK